MLVRHTHTHWRMHAHTHTHTPRHTHKGTLKHKLVWKCPHRSGLSKKKKKKEKSHHPFLQRPCDCIACKLCTCMCVFTSTVAHWHTIQPHVPSQQPTSSNAPFEVELDELCCIKQSKSSMCFYGDIPHTTKTSTGHFRPYKWACDDDSVYIESVSVCVCCDCTGHIKTHF